MNPNRNIDTTNGGGPWSVPNGGLPELQPGELYRVDLRRIEYRGTKRYFQPWLPVDNAVIKNLDTANGVSVEYNGQFDAFVEPNAVDSFGDAGIVSVVIRNEGDAAIDAGKIKLQVSKDAYDADEAAREDKNRHPVERMIRETLNL